MSTLISNITTAWTNAHIRWPLLGAIALEIIPVWAPDQKVHCQETQKVLLAYGVLAAANSAPTPVTKP